MTSIENPRNLAEILRVTEQAADLGRKVLLDYFGHLSQVDRKDMAGLVTEADLESEKVITEFLESNYPEFAVIAEEASYQNDNLDQSAGAKGRWFIDPLDGTTNYVHGFPVFCISIGLEINGEIVVALVDAPKMGQRFTAVKGGGAFLNGEAIQVSDRKDLSDALLATGFFTEDKVALKEQFKVFSYMVERSRGIRRPGAAAYDLCMVASGVFDVFWEKNLSPWDTAAGCLLVTEAGGQVSNYQGQDYHPEMKTIIASNTSLHDEVCRCIGTALT